MKKSFLFLLITIFVYEFYTTDVYGIPAFARKYRMSCKTCHSPMPRLKAYGDEFAGNGFKLADKQAPRYFVETGDSELSLIRDFPLALRMDAHVTYRNEPQRNDFKTPWILKLLSGGEIANNVAYYFYFYLSEYGEVAGVEDAYIMFNNLFGSELDIYAGQFQVSDPLFKRELRLTLEDYSIYKVKPSFSDISLAYDRGFMFTYGFDTGTDVMFEVLNGNGLSQLNGLRQLDKDDYKNLAGRITQDVGDFLRVGFFGYFGQEMINIGSVNQTKNKMHYWGPDLTLSYNDKIELNVQYLQREDDVENSTVYSDKIKTRGGLAELIITPNGDDSKWYAVGMFNLVESDMADLNYRTAALHIGHLLNRNIRLVGEYTYNLTYEFNQVGIGVVTAF
jgi:hypothetical protein